MSGTRPSVALESIPTCFEGTIPSAICTAAADGTPNVTFLSVVHRVDHEHVALSRQFFKKTEENTVVNPLAQVNVVEPETGRMFQLDLRYERTETEGPLFERLRTKLDAVAAHEGMTNVFRLRGVDVCRVLHCELVPCDFPEGPPPRVLNLEKMEQFSQRIAAVDDMEDLLATALEACRELLDYRHAFIMLVDETGERLYTVASSGFASSGAGSEARMGEGILGLAAARRQSIRIANMARELKYSHAARSAGPGARSSSIEEIIPLPGLPSVQSQLITPMLAHRELVGVLALQSEVAGQFQAHDECVAGIVANQVAMALSALPRSEPPALATASRPVQVKHYSEDDSVFLDNEYLIKGVAGGILWRLLRLWQDEGRAEFSNKEMRLDQTLDLPDIKDNLEARLILLRKRLEERCDYLRIERTARGRFRLVVTRELALVAVQGGGPL